MESALRLPDIEKLKRRAYTSRKIREQTEMAARVALIVESHWNELSYETRSQLRSFASQYETSLNEPRTLVENLQIVCGIIPFAVSLITNNDHFVSRYAFERARVVLAIKQQREKDDAAAREAWHMLSATDSDFVAQYERGNNAALRGNFISVDWTKKNLTS